MRKRIMAWALAGIVCITLFSGCGSKTETQSRKEVKTTEIEIPESQEMPESDMNDNSSIDDGEIIHLDFSDSEFENNINSEESGDRKNEDLSEDETEPVGEETHSDETIEEQVIWDQGGIRITAIGIDRSGSLGPGIKVLIENESDKDIFISTENASVNGYMVGFISSVIVKKGEKSEAVLNISGSEMDELGVSSIADVEFDLKVNDQLTYDRISDPVHVSLKTSIADSYDYKFDDVGKIAYDENGIKIVIKGLDEANTHMYGASIKVYIENNSDGYMIIDARNGALNGTKIQPYFVVGVMPGKRAISRVGFLSDDLYDNGIKEIKEAEFQFRICDMSDSSDDDIESKMIKITF